MSLDGGSISELVAVAQSVQDRVQNGAMVSYAQNYEDVLLRRLFPEPETGFFIDIGAFHPTRNSVTQHFHLRGWTGVNVDVDRENITRFEKTRSVDINICTAVGAEPSKIVMHRVPGSSRSTIDATLAQDYRDRGMTVVEELVEVETLASLCKRLSVPEISFLKIDVEGAEDAVIAGADWERFRPICVLAEATYPETDKPAWHGWQPMLLGAGYVFAAFDGLNRYYVREESADLAERLKTPPNYFDDFVRADTSALAEGYLSVLEGEA